MVEVTVDNITKHHSQGFLVLPLFFQDSKLRNIIVYSGSPRILFSLESKDLFADQIPGLGARDYELGYQFWQVSEQNNFRKLAALTAIVPEMAVFSSEDQFPGLIGSKIPVRPLESLIPLNASIKRALYLYRFKIVLENLNEQEILESIKESKQLYYGIHRDKNCKLLIEARRLQVFIHNTWKPIG